MDHIYIEAAKKFVSNYLDSMPTKSRVTLYDLSNHLHNTLGINKNDAYNITRDIVANRSDFHVYRGMGACKL